MPKLNVQIKGEGTGGGGVDYIVSVDLTTFVSSPYSKSKIIKAIIWTHWISAKHIMSYDQVAKKLVNVPGDPSEKINNSVRLAITQLADDLHSVNK